MTCPFTTNKLPLLVLHEAISLNPERVAELQQRIDRELMAIEGEGSEADSIIPDAHASDTNGPDAPADEARPIVLFCAASCWDKRVYRDPNSTPSNWRAFNWTHEFPWRILWLYRQIAADPSLLSVRGLRHRWRVTKACTGILQIAMYYEVPMIALVAGGAVCADAARVAQKHGWCKSPAAPTSPEASAL